MRRTPCASETAWHELQTILDEELARLPENYRAAVILCCLEAKTQEEAAQQLGCPLGTVRSRLARGRKLLHKRLTRRGLTLSTAAFATALTASAATGVAPAALVNPAIKAALLIAAGRTASEIATPTIAKLVDGGMKALAGAKIKIAMGLLLAVSFIGSVAGYRLSAIAHQPEAEPPRAVDEPKAGSRRPKTDPHGDQLPPGALMRMGTVRLRHQSAQVEFDANGKTVISWGPELVVRHWDVATGREVFRQQLKTPRPAERYWMIDRQTLVTVEDHALHLYDGAAGKAIRSIYSRPDQFFMEPFSSRDRKYVAATLYEESPPKYPLHLWDLGTGKEIVLPESNGVLQAKFSADGKLLAIPGGDGTLRLYDTATGQEVRKLPIHPEQSTFSPDGRTLAGWEWMPGVKKVRVWDAVTGKELAAFDTAVRDGTHSFSLAFSPDGKCLAGGEGHTLYLWDLTGRKEMHRFPFRWAYRLNFSPDGKTLAASGASAITLWDVATGKRLLARSAHEMGVSTVAVSPDGKVLGSSSFAEDTLQLWDVASGKPVRLLQGHKAHVSACVFSSDSRLAATSSQDGTVRIWETTTGKEIRQFVVDGLKGSEKPSILALGLSADDKRLTAISSGAGAAQQLYQISVWQMATGKLHARREFTASDVDSFSTDGRYVVRRMGEGVILQDAATGMQFLTLSGRLCWPWAFSPDGKLVAASSFGPGTPPYEGFKPGQEQARREAICIWEMATGKEVLRIPIAGYAVYKFSPDGRMLAAADEKALRLWDTATGQELHRRPRPENFGGQRDVGFVQSLAFLPDGRALATGLADTTIIVWDLAPETWPKAVVKDFVREELEGLWKDLGDDDARKAHHAIHALAASPRSAVPFLEDHLKPVPEADPKRIQELLANIDREQFAVREAAANELARLREQAEPALRRTLAGKPSLEVRKRVEELVAAPRAVPVGPTLRTMRAIQALERIGTREARAILRQLAAGAAGARETREAKEALDRGGKRTGKGQDREGTEDGEGQ